MVICFFLPVFLIFYTYVLFPAILSVLSKGKSLKTWPDADASVSIIISVYNEEKVIAHKLDSILACNFPTKNLEILIGSDCSDDNTNQIVSGYAHRYNFIKLFSFTERRGKPSVVNELMTKAKFPLVILTDANVFFEKKVIHKLVNHFSDSKTGLVGANILNVGMRADGISVQEKSYIARENLIKYREGIIWGCMMGPFGGCYALRKDLYVNVPAGFLVDDFYIALKIIEKGLRCVNDLDAICYEDVSNEMRQEYKRKSRISAGNYQNLKSFSHLLFKPFSKEGFCFISHKFLRWMTPFFIILSLVALIFLSQDNNLYRVLLVGEILLLLSPLIDWIVRLTGLHLKFLRFIAYFSYMNLALLRGFFRYAGGIKSGVWNPTKRS